MKNYFKITCLTLITSLAIIYISGCRSNTNNFEELIDNTYEVRIYEVFGMDCPGCHGGLENLVNKIPGVKMSKANWEKQQLKVAFEPDSDVDDSVIFEAIKKANFTPGKRVR